MLAAALASCLCAVASAQATRPQTTIVYSVVGPGVSDWPVYIAQQRGFFAREGLNVVEEVANNLQNCINAVVTNDAQVAIVGSDAIVVARGHHLPLKMIAPTITVDTYGLVTPSSVKSWDDLRGKTILVTNLSDLTFYSFQKMAQAHHLDANRDFSMISSGSSALRLAALKSGNAQGAMLIQPFDLSAESQGMKIFEEAADYVKDWLSNGIAVNEDWGKAHRADVVAFLRAVNAATRYGYDHPQDAIAILAQATKTSEAVARQAYALDFTKWHAFQTNGRIDERALQNVIAGVVRAGELSTPVAYSDLVDGSYESEATR